MIFKGALSVTAFCLFMLCFSIGAQGAGTTNQCSTTAVQPLEGTWEGFMVGAEANGKVTITITGNSLHFHRDTNFWFETTFTLPAGTDPKQLRATIKDSGEEPPKSIGEAAHPATTQTPGFWWYIFLFLYNASKRPH